MTSPDDSSTDTDSSSPTAPPSPPSPALLHPALPLPLPIPIHLMPSRDRSSWWSKSSSSPQDRKSSVRWDSLPSPATADHSPSLFTSIRSLFKMSSQSISPRRSRAESLASRPTSPNPTSLTSPAMIRFILLCALWYASSAFSSNTGKQIMNQFRYPVTLTFVQFGFVSGYCLLFANPWFGYTRLRAPNAAILRNTLPMAVFQVGGHIFSSMAISRVPVSTVHTIKALSPLFTVGAYALLFGVRYSARTYISLLPLTFGVMFACSFDLNLDNALGLVCAFGSAIVFVTSNIFFKKIMPSQPAGNTGGPLTTPAHKLDKLNLLFYSSGLAFLLMIPLWLWSDLGRLLDHDHHPQHHAGSTPPRHGVMYYFFLNGTVHWAQNIIAFAILSSTSPVTYSIASLIKRIAVILIAIAWFKQSLHPIQAFGMGLTFVGLYMYNNAKADVERGEKRMRRVEARMSLSLPMSRAEARLMDTPMASPQPDEGEWDRAGMPSYSVSSALQQQAGHIKPFPQPPSHNRNQSLVPVHLMAAPSAGNHGGPTSIPHAHSGFSHPAAPPRLDTSTIHHAKHTHHQPMSPTESYPSPPASLDSPPHSAIAAFAAGPPNANLFNRRPTVYESSSISGLDSLSPGDTKDSPTVDGLGVNVNGQPIIA